VNPAALLPLSAGTVLALMTAWQYRRGVFYLRVRQPRGQLGFWLGFACYAAFALFLLGYGIGLQLTGYRP